MKTVRSLYLRKPAFLIVGIVTLVMAIGFMVLQKRVAQAAPSCGYNTVQCMPIAGTLPSAYITCYNGVNHDAAHDWLAGRTSVALSFCDFDRIDVQFGQTSSACLVTTDSPVILMKAKCTGLTNTLSAQQTINMLSGTCGLRTHLHVDLSPCCNSANPPSVSDDTRRYTACTNSQ